MRIQLKNFLCYDNATFDFGQEGIALLSGPSGAGKTTILKAIFFALFGEGTKLQTYGKTSCSVELEFDGIKVLRTKRPNHLVVNDIYEDAAAQEIINKKFGDTFKTSGYIQQNNLNSFILMSPIEKLAFLETFAFRDVDLGKIKGRCKAHISKNHDELLSLVSQLDMANGVLNEMKPPIEVKFPLQYKNQKEKAIKNENIRYKNCTTLINRYKRTISKITKEINDLKVLEATLQSRKETFDSINEKLKNLEIEISDHVYEGDDKLEEYENRLKKILTRRELYSMEEKLQNDQTKLAEMKETEMASLHKNLETINDVLWKEYSKESLQDTISELKICLGDLEKVEQLNKEIKRYTVDTERHKARKEELENYIAELSGKQILHDKLLVQKELYSCPQCMAKLRLLNKELILAEDLFDITVEADIDSLKEDIAELKHNISKLQRVIPVEESKLQRKVEVEEEIATIKLSYKEMPEIDEIKDDLEYLREYQASQLELEKKKRHLEKEIKNEQFSLSYETFKTGIKKLQLQVSKLREESEDNNDEMNEEDLRQKIIEQQQTRAKITELKDRSEKMKNERDRCKEILNNVKRTHIDTYGDIHDEDKLVIDVQKERKNIEEQEKKRKEHEENLEQIALWEKYQVELEKYQMWIDKVDDLNNKVKKAKNEYAAATQLKDKILEAESIAMLNIIDSINTHARVYLDCFFVEYPISVQLQPFQQTKESTKPKINIAIEYKGMEADMSMLSGGELSRVILAYTLALAEMFNTPLLLLDECTSSLDQELSGTVFDAIRENFNGKITLLIAHQVVTGTFDKVIQLGKTIDSE
jgi:exonuclease SbcC